MRCKAGPTHRNVVSKRPCPGAVACATSRPTRKPPVPTLVGANVQRQAKAGFRSRRRWAARRCTISRQRDQDMRSRVKRERGTFDEEVAYKCHNCETASDFDMQILLRHGHFSSSSIPRPAIDKHTSSLTARNAVRKTGFPARRSRPWQDGRPGIEGSANTGRAVYLDCGPAEPEEKYRSRQSKVLRQVVTLFMRSLPLAATLFFLRGTSESPYREIVLVMFFFGLRVRFLDRCRTKVAMDIRRPQADKSGIRNLRLRGENGAIFGRRVALGAAGFLVDYGRNRHRLKRQHALPR